MDVKSFATGVKILAKYADNFGLCAEHDQIWIHVEKPVNNEDHEALKNLNWFIDEAVDENARSCFT